MPPKTPSATVPKILKFGSISFPVFTTKDKRIGFRYKVGSQWKQAIRSDVDDLRADADRIALSILNAETETRDMSAADRRIYIAAREYLASAGIDLDVDAGIRILVNAARHAGSVENIIKACQSFSHTSGELLEATTAVIVAKFIHNLASDGVSTIYIKKMGDDLGKFAARFPCPICEVKAGPMEEWLREMPIGLRRRRNLIDKLVILFKFARKNKALPPQLITEAEMIKRPKIQRKAPQIYTPEEIGLLIAQCAQRPDKKTGLRDYWNFLPSLCIGAFAGLRMAEIQNLDWNQVHWDDGVIEVGEENKTGYRLVPIEPNLMSWIAPFRKARGKVCEYKRPDHVMTSLRKRAGLPRDAYRYSNALRHSCVSYQVAVTKNMPLVAYNSGHSVAELKKSYNRASLEKVGKQWFSITRDENNVIQMPLMSMRG